MTSLLRKIKFRWKLLIMALPLVICPIFIVSALIGYIANHQAYLGITKTSKDDLQHIAAFTIDLLDSHYQQFQLYKQDKLAGSGADSKSIFERKAFATLKEKIKSKKVGSSGYIFCMDSSGTFTIHPDAEGQNFFNATESNDFSFIREMCKKRSGWIRYPWRNSHDSKPRVKIVRYEYFQPWDWIIAVGSYEDEFYHEANQIKSIIIFSMILLILIVGTVASILVFRASNIITNPITNMIAVIRAVRQGKLEEKMLVDGDDELSEMADAFNRMTEIIQHNRDIEAKLAQQGKMASLGVLSSGVAHEINNPLSVILGYAAYLERKIDESDPNYKYIHEIKRESKRCKKIVQDLLSYARTPRPILEPIDLNNLFSNIVDFAANHTDMRRVTIIKEFASNIPKVPLDGDQMRQVAINLILNAGGAMPDGGTLTIKTELYGLKHVRMSFSDTGYGIQPEEADKIFEPFYTTKDRGTGLGLPITRQIIEQHHGEISITSEPGKGAKVTLILPLKRDEFY